MATRPDTDTSAEQAPDTDDIFSSAFAELTLPEGAKPEPVAEAAPVVAEPVVEPAAEPVVEPAAEPVVEPEAKAEPIAEPGADDILNRLSRLVKEAPAAKPDAPAAEPAPAAVELPELYTEDEKSFLANYEKDWPDVARAEGLRRKSEYRDLVGFIFEQIGGQFAPIKEMVDEMAARTHLGDITAKVEDYAVVREQVIDWVGKQPAYLQTAYKQVIEQGTADEVTDLIERYRKEAGGSAPAPKPAPETKEPELSPAAKQAAAALAPVSSKRSTIPQGEDASNFDAAFAKFADQV